MSVMWQDLDVEELGRASFDCECCGNQTSRVWGIVNHEGATIGTYFVNWTALRPDHGAIFDFIVGEWGEGSASENRFAIRAEYRIVEGREGFFGVVGVPDDAFADLSALAAHRLDRADVIDTPLAPEFFAMCDAVFMKDPRLADLRSWSD